jgi:NADH dehydrogenase (ubiquinone) 1 alpha subcomplex subunit 5
LIQDRLQAVKAEPNIEKLETKINSGQIEEVIIQAERELHLARRMLEWRAWEPLTQEAPATQWKWPI